MITRLLRSTHQIFYKSFVSLNDVDEFYVYWNLYLLDIISIYAFILLVFINENFSEDILNCIQYILNLTTIDMDVRDKDSMKFVMNNFLVHLNFAELVYMSQLTIPAASNSSTACECTICMQEYDSKYMAKLWCGHEFCILCIMKQKFYQEIQDKHIDYTKYFFNIKVKSYPRKILKKYGETFMRMTHKVCDDSISTYCPYRCCIHIDTYKNMYCTYKLNQKILRHVAYKLHVEYHKYCET